VQTSPFSVTCSSGLPYTMALDATGGTLLAIGISYTLALSPPATTGTGGPQPYLITGTIAGGQAGICSSSSVACSASQLHAVTITY
jgi:hypothetical protein